MFANVKSCLLVFTYAYHYLLVCTYVYHCLLEFTYSPLFSRSCLP